MKEKDVEYKGSWLTAFGVGDKCGGRNQVQFIAPIDWQIYLQKMYKKWHFYVDRMKCYSIFTRISVFVVMLQIVNVIVHFIKRK